MLGTHQLRRAPHATGLHLESALGSNRTHRTDAEAVSELSSWVFNNRIGLWWDAQPNGSRLSCGALKKKVSFNILRAPPASTAC